MYVHVTRMRERETERSRDVHYATLRCGNLCIKDPMGWDGGWIDRTTLKSVMQKKLLWLS